MAIFRLWKRVLLWDVFVAEFDVDDIIAGLRIGGSLKVPGGYKYEVLPTEDGERAASGGTSGLRLRELLTGRIETQNGTWRAPGRTRTG